MKDIRSKFIVSEEFVKDRIEELAERALMYGRVTTTGTIILGEKSLSRDNVVKLSLVLRYIAHTLDDSILQTLRPIDLTSVLPERIESIGSRLSRLVKEGFAKKMGYGQYSVHPYKIDVFLGSLDDRKSESDGHEPSLRTVTRGPRKQKEFTGIGLDIQKLLESGFFDIPRLVSEIDAELRKETHYHDPKVIDMTIRKTFVGNRKSLKRIPNTEGGKARWRYVRR